MLASDIVIMKIIIYMYNQKSFRTFIRKHIKCNISNKIKIMYQNRTEHSTLSYIVNTFLFNGIIMATLNLEAKTKTTFNTFVNASL